MRSFDVLGASTRTNYPSWCPMEQAGAQINSRRAPLETVGPLGPLYGGPPWTDAAVSKNPSYVYACHFS